MTQQIHEGPLPSSTGRRPFVADPIGVPGLYQQVCPRRVRALVWSTVPGDVAVEEVKVDHPGEFAGSATTFAKPSTREKPWVVEADVWADNKVRLYFRTKDGTPANGGYIVELVEDMAHV